MLVGMGIRACAFLLCLLALCGLTGSALRAETDAAGFVPSIRTLGEAVVTAKPDQAHIDIGVVTQGATAEAAASQNAAQTAAVIAALRAGGPGAPQIKTAGYSLEPVYVYPHPGGKSELQGYTARNTVAVTTGDLAGVGKLVDSATQAGANNIQQLQFTLRDEQAARTEALRLAVAKAMEKAQAMASALGLRVLRVLSVEEGTAPAIRPMMVEAMRAQAGAPTPIEAGSLEIRASVTLKVEIGK